MNVELARRLGAIAAARFECLADHIVFKLCDCRRKIALGDTLRATITRQQDLEVRRIDPVSAHEYDRSFDHISEFAHVSRPGMILQTLDRRRSQGLGRIGPSRKLQKMSSQQFDISTPLM